jgi:two-component system OmpR family response regulator
MRILLIEDDCMIGNELRHALQEAGLAVDWARDGVRGQAAISGGEYAVVILDLVLPRKSGLDVLKEMRQSGDPTPALIVTALGEVEERVTGLDLGADDYLVKPFSPRELIARIRALMRRRNGFAESRIGNGEITLDLASHEATYHGRTAILPSREFALLHALLEHPGAILSRRRLEQRIYGWGEEVESNAVEVLIHYIRRKFDAGIIRNVRGTGWRVTKRPP